MNLPLSFPSRCWATIRASTSDSPPGVMADTIRTGLAGQDSVWACAPAVQARAAASDRKAAIDLTVTMLASWFHGALFNFQISREVAGLVRLFHLGLGAAAPEKRIERVVGEACIGLLHRLVHGRERRARGGGDPVAEPGEIALLEWEIAKAVGRREAH